MTQIFLFWENLKKKIHLKYYNLNLKIFLFKSNNLYILYGRYKYRIFNKIKKKYRNTR